LRVCRYVERNALRARLVERAEEWQWCSLWRRRQKVNDGERVFVLAPPAWPVEPPRDWVAAVNRAESREELDALRSCVRRGAPFGKAEWQKRTAVRLGLESSLRPRGRPKKDKKAEGDHE
jgi:putative transposase